MQLRYKEEGRRSQSMSVYSQLPETNDIQLARIMSEQQSEVHYFYVQYFFFSSSVVFSKVSLLLMCLQTKYREAGRKAASSCLYSKLPETLETHHAKEVSQLQSQVTCGVDDITQGAGQQSSSLFGSL